MKIEQRTSIAGNVEFVVIDENGVAIGVFKSEEVAQQRIIQGTDFENPELKNYEEVWADEIKLMGDNLAKNGQVL